MTISGQYQEQIFMEEAVQDTIISNSVFTRCITSQHNGGAVHIATSSQITVLFQYDLFSTCLTTTLGGFGGAIFASKFRMLGVSQSCIYDCSAFSGQAIYSQVATTITNSSSSIFCAKNAGSNTLIYVGLTIDLRDWNSTFNGVAGWGAGGGFQADSSATIARFAVSNNTGTNIVYLWKTPQGINVQTMYINENGDSQTIDGVLNIFGEWAISRSYFNNPHVTTCFIVSSGDLTFYNCYFAEIPKLESVSFHNCATVEGFHTLEMDNILDTHLCPNNHGRPPPFERPTATALFLDYVVGTYDIIAFAGIFVFVVALVILLIIIFRQFHRTSTSIKSTEQILMTFAPEPGTLSEAGHELIELEDFPFMPEPAMHEVHHLHDPSKSEPVSMSLSDSDVEIARPSRSEFLEAPPVEQNYLAKAHSVERLANSQEESSSSSLSDKPPLVQIPSREDSSPSSLNDEPPLIQIPSQEDSSPSSLNDEPPLIQIPHQPILQDHPNPPSDDDSFGDNAPAVIPPPPHDEPEGLPPQEEHPDPPANLQPFGNDEPADDARLQQNAPPKEASTESSEYYSD